MNFDKNQGGLSVNMTDNYAFGSEFKSLCSTINTNISAKTRFDMVFAYSIDNLFNNSNLPSATTKLYLVIIFKDTSNLYRYVNLLIPDLDTSYTETTMPKRIYTYTLQISALLSTSINNYQFYGFSLKALNTSTITFNSGTPTSFTNTNSSPYVNIAPSPNTGLLTEPSTYTSKILFNSLTVKLSAPIQNLTTVQDLQIFNLFSDIESIPYITLTTLLDYYLYQEQAPTDYDRIVLQNSNQSNNLYLTCAPNTSDSTPETTIFGNLYNNKLIKGKDMLLNGEFVSQHITTATLYQYSDRRIKTNIIDSNNTINLEKILKFKVKEFNQYRKKEKVLGFIAQELKEIDDLLVETSNIQVIPNILKYVENIRLGGRTGLIICSLTKYNLNEKDLYEFDVLDKKENVIYTIHKLSISKINENEFFISNSEISNFTDIISNLLSGEYRLLIIGSYVNDFHTINNSRFFGLLVSSIQELNNKIDSLSKPSEEKIISKTTLAQLAMKTIKTNKR